jgi:hypothetical protein
VSLFFLLGTALQTDDRFESKHCLIIDQSLDQVVFSMLAWPYGQVENALADAAAFTCDGLNIEQSSFGEIAVVGGIR